MRLALAQSLEQALPGPAARPKKAHSWIAVRDNLRTYHEVEESGLGNLYSLGAEVFGRWCTDAVGLVPQLLHERCRGLPQSVRVSLQAGLSRRWWGLLGVAVQRQVARAILRGPGYDLVEHALEPPPHLSDLPAG